MKTYNKCKAKSKQTRIDLKNKTKLNIANQYLKQKRNNRNYNAKQCKLYFLSDKNIECGATNNITKWSRNINTIKQNIKRFGENKKRNRQKKWHYFCVTWLWSFCYVLWNNHCGKVKVQSCDFAEQFLQVRKHNADNIYRSSVLLVVLFLVLAIWY